MPNPFRTLLLLLALLLAGCTTWHHPSATPQQFAGDQAYCDALGAQAAAGLHDPLYIVRQQTMINCMVGKGYTAR